MEEPRRFEGLSFEELEAQRVELLPDRQEMQDVFLIAGAAAAVGSAAGSGAAANNVTVNTGEIAPDNTADITF